MTTDGTDPPGGDDLDRSVSGVLRVRRVVIGVLVTLFLALPAVSLFTKQGLSGDAAFLVPGTVVFIVLVNRWVLTSRPQPSYLRRGDMVILVTIVVLGAALFAVGQMNWLTALAVAAAGAGRFAATRPRAAIGVAACAAVGLAVSVSHNLGYGAMLAAIGVPLLGGLFAYSAERRNVLMFKLNQARAELARTAVAEERLRISRDLHDLLGHSLSLIALKSELAGRMIESDPPRAAREIAELEAVARRSLAEVRQAVTGYRQPSLAAELAAARRMLASAGIDCRVDAPTSYDLPPEVDALLAWTVREASTNIVRHSGARHAGITIAVTGASASAEVTDDGAGAPGTPGSGLAGLAERAGRLGGALLAGAREGGGFGVRVTVPIPAAGTGDRREHPVATAGDEGWPPEEPPAAPPSPAAPPAAAALAEPTAPAPDEVSR
ncbi:MAG TPA: sensor histidine kinase [Streptosporangiaceae bacterium]|nr:sensor histidine kinase [Streptosporangiaceae bacterium]